MNITFYFQVIIKARQTTFNSLLLLLLLSSISCGEETIAKKESISIKAVEHTLLNEEKAEIEDIIVADNLLELNIPEGLVLYQSKPFSGTSVSHYPDSTQKSSTAYFRGKKHGLKKKWFKNGKLSYEGNYLFDKRQGKTKSWWINGNLRSVSQFVDGIGQGEQLQFYKSGAKLKKINLVDGKEEGMQQSWRENGKIYNNYEAKNGRIFGLKRSNLCYALEDENVVYSKK